MIIALKIIAVAIGITFIRHFYYRFARLNRQDRFALCPRRREREGQLRQTLPDHAPTLTGICSVFDPSATDSSTNFSSSAA